MFFIKKIYRLTHKLLCILKKPKLLIYLIKYGVLPSFEHKFLKKNSYNTLLDVGANKGQFSLYFITYCRNSKVYAFEPLDSAAKIYQKIFFKLQNVNMFNFAIGNMSSKSYINVSARSDSSSILNITELQNNIFPGTHKIRTEEIYIKKLKDLIEIEKLIAPVLLKLDVQGYELNALKGCSEFLPYIDTIYCEVSFIELYEGQSLCTDIVIYLNKFNFILSGIFNLTEKNGVVVQADFLFEKN